MKKNIHPDYDEFTVIFTNGESAKFKSSAGKKLGTFKLDIDPFNAPAWKVNGEVVANANNTQVNKFNKKFGSSIFTKNK